MFCVPKDVSMIVRNKYYICVKCPQMYAFVAEMSLSCESCFISVFTGIYVNNN